MIYFIKTNGQVKIGYTDNLNKRIAAYRTHNPQAELIAEMDGDRATEKAIHKQLASDRIKGEWFNHSQQVKDYIREHAIDQCHTKISKEGMHTLLTLKSISAFKLGFKVCELAEYNTGKITLSKIVREQVCRDLGIATSNLSKAFKELKENNLIVGEKNDYELKAKLLWRGELKEREIACLHQENPVPLASN